MLRPVLLTTAAVGLVFTLAAGDVRLVAQTNGEPIRLSAWAVSMANKSWGSAATCCDRLGAAVAKSDEAPAATRGKARCKACPTRPTMPPS